MHPPSLAELNTARVSDSAISEPRRRTGDSVAQLLRFGGFPEPFLKGSVRFHNRWRRLRGELLFREDLRDLTQIQEAGQVQVLGDLWRGQVCQLVNCSTLARSVNVSVGTIRRWIGTLESLYYCFTVRPWYRNLPKSLRDTNKREVDFGVIRDGESWFLVEAKTSGRRAISPSLSCFAQKLGVKHAFQAALDLDCVEEDCFGVLHPVRVPVVTLLSQLV